MQNRIKSKKYFSIHQYQNFRKFNIKHLQWSKADSPLHPSKKKILRKGTLRISVASVRRCAVKKVSLKNLPLAYWHITISLKFMILITFKIRDKICSKIEKIWFLLLQWVAKSSIINGKVIFILIYLNNN